VLEGLLLEAENFLGVVTLVTQDLVVHTEMGVADVDDVRITRAVTELAEVVHADDLVLLGDHFVLLIDEDIVPLEICDGDLGRVFLRVELVLVENERDLPRAIAHLSVVVPRVAVVPARVDDLDFSVDLLLGFSSLPAACTSGPPSSRRVRLRLPSDLLLDPTSSFSFSR
jgi:hypothetical protein